MDYAAPRQFRAGANKSGGAPAQQPVPHPRTQPARSAFGHSFASLPIQQKSAQPGASPVPAGPAADGKASGLPDKLRLGIERLSGLPMHGVQVHYNSPKPAQLQAHAYAQDGHIHLGPGHERYLAHEAWHLVQQLQRRVPVTARAGDIAINDHPALEREADVMGERAHRVGSAALAAAPGWRGAAMPAAAATPSSGTPAVAQCGGGARSKRRKRFRNLREGKRAPRKGKQADALHQADFGEKAVTVYRVEHDKKPSIVDIAPGNGARPGPNVSFSNMPADSTHYFSFGTPARALANRRQRLKNQLAAHDPGKHGGSRVLPADMTPKLKSFKVSNEFARRIQRTAVTQDQKAAFPSSPENSDQNWAPDQYGLTDAHVREMERHVLPNSGKLYSDDDMAELAALHGSGQSADDHLRDHAYPKGELRKKLQVRRPRGSGKRNRKMFKQPLTYDRASDPHEREETDDDIDPQARRYLIRR